MSLSMILSGIKKPVASMEAEDANAEDVAEQVESTEEVGEEEAAEGEDAGEEEAGEGEEEGDDAGEEAGEEEATDDAGEEEEEADESTGEEEEEAGEEESTVGTADVEEGDLDETVPVYESIPVDSDSAEIIEMNSSMESYELALDDSDDLESRIDTLDQLHTGASNSLDNGGLNQDAAVVLKIAITAITDKASTDTLTPSVESFGGTFQRRASTEASIKGMGEMIKSAARSAGKFIMDLLRRAKEALVGMFNNRKGMEMKTERVMEDAKGFKGKESAVKLTSSDAKILTNGGKILGGAELMNQYIGFLKLATKLVDDVAPFQFVKEITGAKIDTSSDEAFKKSYDALTSILSKFPVNAAFDKVVTTEYKELLDAGLTVKSTAPLFDATDLIIAHVAGEATGAAQAGKQFVRAKKGDSLDAVEIKGFSADAVLKLAETSPLAYAILDNAKAKADTIDAMIKDVGAMIKRLESAADKTDTLGKSAQGELKELATALRKVLVSMTVQIITVAKITTSTTNVILKVCNTSLKGTSAKDDAADEASKSGKALPKPKAKGALPKPAPGTGVAAKGSSVV